MASPYITKRNQPKLEEDQNTSTAKGDGTYRSTPEEQGLATGRNRGGSMGGAAEQPAVQMTAIQGQLGGLQKPP